ncbi:Ig-like domain-containing protein, partial [bacterium]|nr:Ig-like domain-containing protein [bacterium]
ALADDSILQVLYGDLITMTYRDKNDLAEFESWEVFTSGPRSLELFKVVGAIETNIFTGATQTEEIYYEDDIRVKLYIPEFELDGSSGTTTDTIITGSGADEDLLALREFGDTGMLIPDSAVYGGATTFKVTKTDTGVQTNLLFISSTPRTVTVSYPDAVTPVETLSFTMFDQDVPIVTIDSPTDGSSVTGTVIISVNAADISNTSASGGITLIELYVNGRLIDSVMGADLSGANAFTWTTAIGSTPYWLDGTHVLTARAFDTSNNPATSDPVSVKVENGQNPLWFNVPSYANSTWSDQVAVQMEVDINPAQSGTYQLILNVNDISAASFSVTGSGTFDHTVVTTALDEGKNTLVAILKNTWTGEYQTTALDFTMDRTPPVINIGTPPDWISIADFALPGMTVDVTVSDPIVAAGDPNDVDDASVKGSFAGVCSSGLIDMSELSAGSDTYSVLWAGPCADVEGSITLTVNASDVANPPNDAPPTSVTTSIDTKMPTIDAPTVSTVLGSLITGTVTIDTQVHDTYPQKVHLEIFDVAGGTFVVNNGGFTDTPLNNVDGSGNFTTTYDTTTVSDGPYIIRVGGWDQAGNEILDPTDYIYFVDNSKPVVDSPYVYNPNNIVDGTVNVRYYASDPFGLIKGVNVVIMADGENPSVDTPLSTETLAFPFDTRNTAVSGVASLDVSSLSNGPYDVYCRATDWAGNQSNWSGNHNMVLDRTYLTAMWGYYSVTGINNDVTVGGTLYDGAAPSVGSTIHLWGRVKPASGDTTWQSYNFYVQTDAAGAYSSTPINNIQAGDLFYVYHYSPWNEFIGYNFATVPGAVTTNYTSYLPRGVQVRQPFMRWTEYPGPDYAADVGGILWDNTGAVSGHNMRVRFNLYDSGGTTYTGFREYTASTAFDGSFSINTWPDLFPEGQRMYVYFYDDTIGGSSLGYFYGNAVPYIMPDPLRPDDF